MEDNLTVTGGMIPVSLKCRCSDILQQLGASGTLAPKNERQTIAAFRCHILLVYSSQAVQKGPKKDGLSVRKEAQAPPSTSLHDMNVPAKVFRFGLVALK